MDKENQELQTVQQNNQMTVQVDSDQQLQQTIDRAERYMQLLDKMRKLACNMTNTDDWVDQGGKPYLQASGCNKVSGGFGVRFYGVEVEKEFINDDKGTYLAYITSGYATWNNKEIHETGTATSRDDFFALRKNKETGEKEFLPLSEIDPMDIRKKSHTNFQNRAIKSVLGLSFTWEEVAKATNGTITKEKCSTVNYNKGSKGGNTDNADTAKKRKEIGEWLLKLCDGEAETAKAKLKEMTTWEKDGQQMEGRSDLKALSEKQVGFLHKKLAEEIKKFDEMIGA
jgi:antitoxin component of MazEF toxin-antitoxin module